MTRIWGQKRKKRNLQDVYTYMEQFVYSYEKYKNIRLVLEDCLSVFSEGGKMHSAIQNAIYKLDNDKEYHENMVSYALEEITNVYCCKKLKLFHLIFLEAEEQGCEMTKYFNAIAHLIYCYKRESIKDVFFYWLILVTIYLEKDSFVNAVERSCDKIEGQFLEEVRQFLDEIYNQPDSPIPYHNFLRKENIPEIRSAMKILYLAESDNYETTMERVSSYINTYQSRMDGNNNEYKSIADKWKWMKPVFGFFSVAFLFAMFLFVNMAAIYENVRYSSARDFYNGVVNEIERSDFHSEVIKQCMEKAKQRGGTLSVDLYGEEKKNARVRMHFEYVVPILQIKRTFTLDGYAR